MYLYEGEGYTSHLLEAALVGVAVLHAAGLMYGIEQVLLYGASPWVALHALVAMPQVCQVHGHLALVHTRRGAVGCSGLCR